MADETRNKYGAPTTTRLPPDVRREAERLARENDRTLAQQVARYVREGVERDRERR